MEFIQLQQLECINAVPASGANKEESVISHLSEMLGLETWSMELLELEILSMIVMDGNYLVFRRESDSRITSVRQSITYISHHAYYWPSYLSAIIINNTLFTYHPSE